MSLQNIPALLWLLPLGGVVILLYLLRMRRRDVRVPATFLWPERTDEVRANSLFQRLRFSWVLVLQLLALTLIVFAIAKPQTQQRGLVGEVTVLVLDASASMGATDIQPSRFEEAVKLARNAILAAHVGDRIALIEAGPNPRVVFPLGNDSAKQVRALESLRRSDAEVDIGEALRLASALVGSETSARIVLLSDGVFEPIKDFSRGKASFVYKSIGESDHNLAISALGVAETGKGPQIYCAVKNPGGKQMAGSLNLYADGKLIDSEKVTVTTAKTWGKTIGAPAGAKVIEAKLETPDFLKADNYAVALAESGASLRVLLIGKGDFFLERALVLDPRVTLDRADELPSSEIYDIVIFDGVPAQPVRAAGVLAFGPIGGESPVERTGSARSSSFVSNESVKLMDGVDLRGVYIDKAERVKPKNAGQVIASGTAGPLIVASKEGQRHLYVAFAPLNSDFPLSVGFPIFVANALDFLAGEKTSSALAVRAGQTFSIQAKGNVNLKTPDGRNISIEPANSTAVVRDTDQIGRYEIKTDEKPRTVYATLRSDRESRIMPEVDLQISGGTVKATSAPMRFADFWRPLAILCLLVLAGEWWLFARKS